MNASMHTWSFGIDTGQSALREMALQVGHGVLQCVGGFLASAGAANAVPHE
jgi:hypothetical protein